MDRIQATPRVNPTIGGLADLLAASYSPQRTQQLQGLMNFLGVPAVAQTLDRISYGEPITTGRGMTTELRPEAKGTAGGVLSLLPMGRPAQSAAVALGRSIEPAVARVVPQVMERGGLPAEMLGAMAQGTQSPATVFHGTPHLFNKFDSSKIGTGEGAQAYGHGLYLAESPDVAQNYAVTTTNFKPVLDGRPVDVSSPKTAADRAIKEFADNRGDVSRAMQMLGITEDKTALKWLKENYKRLSTETGNLMQVDLPDEQIARMLDWDKPLSEQPENVRQAVEQLRSMPLASEYSSGRTVGGELRDDATGFELMMALKRTNPETYFGPRYGTQTSEMLRQAGIPGIRYLDEGSRAAGQGTSNFVVFPGMEDMLRIEQINNQPIESLFQQLGR